MGEGIVVIDLGDVAPADAPDDLLPTPSVDVRLRWRRRIATAVVVLPCLALAAAGPPAPSMPDGFTVAQTRAWFVHDDAAVYLPTGEREVTAYDLDGRVRWRTAIAHDVTYVQLVDGPVAVWEQGDCSMVTRLDAASGRPRWSRVGALVGQDTADGADRILRRMDTCTQQSGEIPPDGTTESVVLDLVDRESGAVRLSVPIAESEQWTFGPDLATVAVWDERGHLVERDLTTGAVVAFGELPALANPYVGPSSMTPRMVLLEDGWAVLDPPSLVADDTEVVVTVYGRRTMDPLWTVRLPGASPDVHQFYNLWPCESKTICVELGENNTVLLDAATGGRRPGGLERREQTVGRHWSITIDLTTANVNGDPDVVLRDGRTGRIVFPTWHVQAFGRDDDAVVALTRVVGEATEFAVFDGHTGLLRELGSARGAYTSCEATSRHLFCVDGSLVLHVWPLPT